MRERPATLSAVYHRVMASGTARIDGVLASWNDERGFGFISRLDGGSSVFVHIKAFPQGSERPRIGEALTFEVETTSDGKTRAARVRPPHVARVAKPRPRGSSARAGAFEYLAIVAFVALYIVVTRAWNVPLWVGSLYLVTSVLSFIVYRADKNAAVERGWRIPERSLLLLGLVGGWPGAIIGQQVLRHKTKKLRFRYLFWICVFLNVLAFLVLTSPNFATIVSRTAAPGL